MTLFRVEVTYQNFVTGERSVKLLPKVYKLYWAAEKAAQRASWVTRPGRDSKPTDSSDARVVTL